MSTPPDPDAASPEADRRSERRVAVVLGLLLVILLVHLAFGDNPWQDGIAKRVTYWEPWNDHLMFHLVDVTD